MRKILIIMILSLTISNSFAQWSIFVGGGGNITMGGKKGAYISTSNKYEYLTPPYHTELSINKNFGGLFTVGFNYLLKSHHLFSVNFNYTFQQYIEKIGTPQVGDKYNPNSNIITSISYYDLYETMNSLKVPLSYGYSFNLKSNAVRITPHVGWINQFVFEKHYTGNKRIHPYFGSIQLGLRLLFKLIYVDFSYERTLTKYYDNLFPSIRLQTLNLSIGYVYTFKKKTPKTQAVE